MLQPEQFHLESLKVGGLVSKRTKSEMGSEKPNYLLSKLHEIPDNSTYNPLERWSMKGNNLIFKYNEMTIWWKMPSDFSFEETHPDLYKLAEFVLVSPFEKEILDGWVPSRKPGFRPGLAFSAGCDSTAAMELLPEQTVLMYHKREGFESKLNHSNALRFIEHLENKCHRPVLVVESNHEQLRTIEGKQVGFVTDYACAVHVILLADYFSLDSIATGMPLENSFLWHGQKFRDFSETWFWKKHAPLFESVGLPILQPVMGCSEIINQRIVELSGFGALAQSCLRAGAGNTCGECWKCFRKNSLRGREITISKEIDTFLNQPKLKMAASTLYSIQKMKHKSKFFQDIMDSYPHIQKLIEEDVQFLEKYYANALELIPAKYRNYVKERLKYFNLEFDNDGDLENFQLYD